MVPKKVESGKGSGVGDGNGGGNTGSDRGVFVWGDDGSRNVRGGGGDGERASVGGRVVGPRNASGVGGNEDRGDGGGVGADGGGEGARGGDGVDGAGGGDLFEGEAVGCVPTTAMVGGDFGATGAVFFLRRTGARGKITGATPVSFFFFTTFNFELSLLSSPLRA